MGLSDNRCWVKVHHSRSGEVVVAICDSELVGRKLTIPGGAKVDVSRAFYCGILVESDELEKYIRQGTIINILGKRGVEAAIKAGFARREAVIHIDGIPHVQIFL